MTVTTALDERNQAPGYAWQSIDLAVAKQADSPALSSSALSLEISSDDGATWQNAWVLGNDENEWHAVVFNPRADRSSGYISLRIHATNDAGNRIDQTVIHAYKLS